MFSRTISITPDITHARITNVVTEIITVSIIGTFLSGRRTAVVSSGDESSVLIEVSLSMGMVVVSIFAVVSLCVPAVVSFAGAFVVTFEVVFFGGAFVVDADDVLLSFVVPSGVLLVTGEVVSFVVVGVEVSEGEVVEGAGEVVTSGLVAVVVGAEVTEGSVVEGEGAVVTSGLVAVVVGVEVTEGDVVEGAGAVVTSGLVAVVVGAEVTEEEVETCGMEVVTCAIVSVTVVLLVVSYSPLPPISFSSKFSGTVCIIDFRSS